MMSPVTQEATYWGSPLGRLWIVRWGVTFVIDLRIRGRKWHLATWKEGPHV